MRVETEGNALSASRAKRATFGSATGGGTPTERATIGESLKRVTEGFSRLVREHLALARTELKQDLRAATRDVALALVGVPLLFLGYSLMMVALALLLADEWGGVGAFAIVGGVNFLAGAVLAAIFGMRLLGRDKPDLEHTTRELKEDRRWLQELRRT